VLSPPGAASPRFFFLTRFCDWDSESKAPIIRRCFFVRHWGALIFAVAGLIVHSAYTPATRTPVLVAAAVENFAMGLVIFLRPVKRTTAMTAIASIEGVFAVLYIAYLAGL
jgi:hypothetical protein